MTPPPLTAQSVLESKQFQIQLVDRLMPEIIKRMKVTLNFRDNYSPLVQVKKDVLASDTYHKAEAGCPTGFRVMGVGGQISGHRTPLGDNDLVTMMIIPTSRVEVVAKMETTSGVMAYATCLGFEAAVSLKEVSAGLGLGRDPLAYLQDIRPQSPSQQQPPSQPPSQPQPPR